MNPKHEARKLRSDVYNVNNAMRMPIDVTEIAKKLNISVEMRELPSLVTGFIIKEASENPPLLFMSMQQIRFSAGALPLLTSLDTTPNTKIMQN